MRGWGANKPSPKQQDVSRDSDSDVSLLSDGEAPAEHDEDVLYPHAATWAEVDVSELERLALSIARCSVPELDRTDPAGLALSEVNNADPLGFGHLDPWTLALTSEAPAAGGPRISLPESVLRVKRTEGGGAAGAADAARLSVRSQLLPSSEHFDPELYLAAVHGDRQLQELVRGLDSLRGQLSEHAGQLKSLVKENFDRFISSKDTIDDVAAKLRAAEAEGGVGVNGATPGEVAAAVARAQEESRRAFGPLLERQARAERLKAVLGLLGQHDPLVGFPSRVRRQAESKDYAGVVEEYNRARDVLAERGGSAVGTASGGTGGSEVSVWGRLMAEVDKVVSSVVYTLETVVSSPQASPVEVFDAVKHLTQLRAAGAPAAAALDPLSLYVKAQQRHVSGLLEAQQQKAQAEAAQRHQRQSRGTDADEATSRFTSGVAATAADLAAVHYVGTITELVVRWVPQFWEVTQGRVPELLSAGASAQALDSGVASAERCLQAILQQYGDAVQGVLASPPPGLSRPGGSGVGHAAALATAADLAAAYSELQRQGAPEIAAQRVRALVALAGCTAARQLQAHLSAAAAALCSAETWDVRLVPRQRSPSTTATVGSLGQLAFSGLRYAAELHAECGRAGVNPLTGPPASLAPHKLLCQTLNSYAEAATGLGGGGGAQCPDHRLLVLCSNLAAVRLEVVPQLDDAWGSLLAAGSPPAEVEAALQECVAAIESAEGRLMATYLERKQAVLDGVMEEFFFGTLPPAGGTPLAASSEWELAPPPQGIRPVCLDLLAALVAVQSELAAGAPALMVDALCELLSGLLAGVVQVVSGGLPGGCTPGGVCQIWLEVSVLEVAVAGLTGGDEALAASFHEAHAVLEQQLQVARDAASGEEVEQLAAWCLGGGVGVEAEPSVTACRQRVQQLCASERAKALHPLRLLRRSLPLL